MKFKVGQKIKLKSFSKLQREGWLKIGEALVKDFPDEIHWSVSIKRLDRIYIIDDYWEKGQKYKNLYFLPHLEGLGYVMENMIEVNENKVRPIP